jgi:hypothetical protein
MIFPPKLAIQDLLEVKIGQIERKFDKITLNI